MEIGAAVPERGDATHRKTLARQQRLKPFRTVRTGLPLPAATASLAMADSQPQSLKRPASLTSPRLT